MYFRDTWSESEMTMHQRELVVSLALLGAFFGSILAGPLSDKIGRKPVIILADILFTIGSISMSFAQTIWFLMVGRLIVGLGVGFASMVVPVYLSEVAPPNVRGKIVASFVMAITIG